MMSTSRRRGDVNPKLHMDRQPTVARITDPSLPAGKRREIDNVMKKARANTNDYWDKKLIEAEEKDPNRWRHTGYKKMYILRGESSSGESDRAGEYRYNSTSASGGVGGPSGRPPSAGRYGRSRSPRSRSRSRLRKSPFTSSMRRRSPHGMDGHGRCMSPPPIDGHPRGRPVSPMSRGGIQPRSPEMGRRPLGPGGARPRSPPEPPMRRKSPRSPMNRRRLSPMGSGMPPGGSRRSPIPRNSSLPNKRAQILPRSKRPPSPPPRNPCRSRTNSSASSCTDDSCSVCSRKHHHRSRSLSRVRVPGGPRSPPPKPVRSMQYREPPVQSHHGGRPVSPSAARKHDKYRDEKVRRGSPSRSIEGRVSPDRHMKVPRSGRHSSIEESRLKNRPPEPPEPASSSSSATLSSKKKKKDKEKEKEIRARIKIEGEKRKKPSNSSSDSDDSGGSDSDSSLPTFTATTRLTLSERFGKMAQWSIDRSNMENMRITKDSVGGALKVMIEEGLETPPRRYSYSPAPAGHFPEELATTAPSGMLSWDDVRVRYEYYKSRGYLRDLDLKDYIKWEEWWYKYQEWLKQERYYEYWERQQLQRRRRKKLPITQRLN